MIDEKLRGLERHALMNPCFGTYFQYGLGLVRVGRRLEARVAFCRALDDMDRSAEADAILLWFPDLAYKFLDWEVVSPRLGGMKQLFTFGASLVRLRANGYARHPRSVEVFGLLADGLRGLLPQGSVWLLVYDDLLNSYGEWISLGFERKDAELLVYVDPEDLMWNSGEGRYVKGSAFRAGETKTFSIQNLPFQQFVDLRLFSNDFVRFLTGCSFTELPDTMRSGNSRSQVFLPPNLTAWPVARGGFSYWYDVIGCSCNYGASRGVRLIVGTKK